MSTRSSKEDDASKGRAPLPDLAESEALELRKLEPKQHFTEPPPRYTEAALVKALEDNGIGRPSTYSTIVETIQARGYVTQQERRFLPTPDRRGGQRSARRALSQDRQSRLHRADGGRSRQGRRGPRRLDRAAAPLLRPVRKRARRRRRRSCRAWSFATSRPTKSVRPAAARWSSSTGVSVSSFRAADIPNARRQSRSSKRPARAVPNAAARSSSGGRVKGALFYGCANYPKCDFISWDAVARERCPVCGSYVIAKTRRGGNVQLQCAADRDHDVTPLAARRERPDRRVIRARVV